MKIIKRGDFKEIHAIQCMTFFYDSANFFKQVKSRPQGIGLIGKLDNDIILISQCNFG